MALAARRQKYLVRRSRGSVVGSLRRDSAGFGRVYAGYGGVFIALTLLWGWAVDKTAPDRFDLIGGTVALVGVAIIMYWPRA